MKKNKMPAKPPEKSKTRPLWLRLRMGRRIMQFAFLFIFMALILATSSIAGGDFNAENSSSVYWPVEAFLDIDPLVTVIVALATHGVAGTVFWGLTILCLAFFLGRGFCGWVCPMGTMNHGISEIRSNKKAKQKIAANKSGDYQKIKYILLIAILVSAALGSAWGGLLDPLCLATRGIALTVLPFINWGSGGIVNGAANSNITIFQHLSDSAFDALSGIILHQRGLIVSGGLTVSIFFIAVLVANRFMPKFWCRTLCPLGALLGVAGRFGILALKKDQSKCNNCKKCVSNCIGAASPLPGEKWQRSECELCMNCVAACDNDALAFGLALKDAPPEQSHPNLKRRQLISGAAIGALIVPALRTGQSGTVLGKPDPACIRPPGAVTEKEFLKRCIRCGQCMKICPNNALHPALDEGGLEGLWTPVLVPSIGYCEPTCTLCSQVCPTAAIRLVSEDQKTGKNNTKMVKIGTAFFDRGRCLPWAMATPCTVCEEFCPISPKAIYLEETEKLVNGKTVKLKLPYINPALCNGCGACENVCPVNDKAAIRVSGAGETRNPANRLLLSK